MVEDKSRQRRGVIQPVGVMPVEIPADDLDIAPGLSKSFGKNIDIGFRNHRLILTAADRQNGDLGIGDGLIIIERTFGVIFQLFRSVYIVRLIMFGSFALQKFFERRVVVARNSLGRK